MGSQRRHLIAALGAWAATFGAAPAAADTLVDNIDGLRLSRDGTVTRFEAMLIDDDGKVATLYRRGEKRKKDAAYRVDGRGRVLLPAFIDAHVDLSALGLAALTLDLSKATNLGQALGLVAGEAARNPARRWIIGRGWGNAGWTLTRQPTAADLDAVVADRAVWLVRADEGAGWANGAALAEAGIDAQTQDPPGGHIERMAGSREPTGILTGTAMALVSAKLPPPRPEERDLALSLAQERLHARGITGVHDIGTTLADWQSLRRAGDDGRLSLRVVAYADGIEEMVTIAGPGPSPWLYGDRLRLAGVSLVLDGDLAAGRAWLQTPVAGSAAVAPRLSGTQLRNLMSRATMDDFQVAIGAHGDAAIAETLRAIEELAESFPGQRRWRIEHATVIAPADIAAMAAAGAIAAMQPAQLHADRVAAETRLAPDLHGRVASWRALEAAGVPLAFGSQAPIGPIAPFGAMASAISRQDGAGEPFGGWQPQERIDRQSALAALTAGAAHAGQSDGRYGSLAPGEWADFVFVTIDPLLASPEQLRDARVLETWLAGRKVWSDD